MIRNDELYIEKSTTTSAPAINYNFYTPPPQGSHLTPSPIGASPPQVPVEVPTSRRQSALRPRPTRPPVRPLYDYYEDYEELPRPKNRKRFRPRHRPVYYDDYEEYEDVRVTRRGGGRRRLYNRRDRPAPARRNKDRRNFDYEDAEYADEDDVVLGKKQKTKMRKPLEDYEYEDDIEYENRRPQNRRDNKPSRKKRPIDDYDYEDDERYDRRKQTDENRDVTKRYPLNNENKKIPRLGKRRPPSQEYEDDLQQADDPQSYERPRKISKEKSIKAAEDGRPIIKPVSGTIYDRPRVAPRINLPVPKNAADKFAYKPIGSPTTPTAKVSDEDYDYYEETISQSATNSKQADSTKEDRGVSEKHSSIPFDDTPANTEKRKIQTSGKDVGSSNARKFHSAVTSTTTLEPEVDQSPMPVIRKFKRPFLPSRGGNPYTARNLQPVGTKAKDESQEIDLGESSVMKSVANPTESFQNKKDEIQDFKQIPVRVRNPLVAKVTITTTAEESTLKSAVQEIAKEEPKSGIIRIKVPIRVKPYVEQEESRSQNLYEDNKYSIPETISTTVQTPLIKEDILNGNYDVTLNEAISPIIPNLPTRSFGGYNQPTDYTYKRFQRPTKYVILDPVVSAGSPYYVK